MLKNTELAEAVRNTAYFLWEQDGRPEGRSFEYWVKAKEMHLRQMAYDRWLAEGTPIGRAEEIWRDVAEEIEDDDA
ncbi:MULTISPECIES: DUF2934 domain-containing protein [unclassified Devosia]|jgi:hypothetical protein|uniref:DUF2934 domain-containing protein n=1 Tax=unclassified Devosia TaxID=196773 RepID=UPI000FDBA407|nr:MULTISPECIES: DUF2934 domain-containing protein [unclassified Devosia]